jgi:hypothetical protein
VSTLLRTSSKNFREKKVRIDGEGENKTGKEGRKEGRRILLSLLWQRIVKFTKIFQL